MFWMLFIVDWNPTVASAQPVGLTVVVRQTVIIFDSVFEQELRAFLTGFPPRRYDASGSLAPEVFDQSIALNKLGQIVFLQTRLPSWTCLVHNCRLLLKRHRSWILVAVAMQANFMAFVSDHSALFGESVAVIGIYH